MSYSSGVEYPFLNSNACRWSDMYITCLSFLSHDACPHFTGHGAGWVESLAPLHPFLRASLLHPHFGSKDFQVGWPPFLPNLVSPPPPGRLQLARRWSTPLEGLEPANGGEMVWRDIFLFRFWTVELFGQGGILCCTGVTCLYATRQQKGPSREKWSDGPLR